MNKLIIIRSIYIGVAERTKTSVHIKKNYVIISSRFMQCITNLITRVRITRPCLIKNFFYFTMHFKNKSNSKIETQKKGG